MNLEGHRYNITLLLLAFALMLATAVVHVMLQMTWYVSMEGGIVLMYVVMSIALATAFWAVRRMYVMSNKEGWR